jgi:hypothetical protein
MTTAPIIAELNKVLSFHSSHIEQSLTATEEKSSQLSRQNLLDFRPMRSITFPRLSRACKLDPMFRVSVSDYFSTLSADRLQQAGMG